MGDMFTGSQKTESDSSSHQTQSTAPWASAVPGLDQLISGIGNSLSHPPQFYPGQTYLSLNGGQTAGLRDVQTAARGMQTGVVNPTMDAWKQMLGGPDGSLWDQALSHYGDRANMELNRTVLPGINDDFTMSGGRNSSRAGIAEGVARADTGRNILDMNNQLAINFEGLKQSGQEFALGQSQNMFNLGLAPGNAEYEAATALRANEANKLNENITRFNYNRDAPLNNMQQMFSMLFPMAQGFGTTTSDGTSHSEQTTSSQSPIFDKLLGAGIAAAGIMNPALGASMGAMGMMGGGTGASPIAGMGFGPGGVGMMQPTQLPTNLYFDPYNPRGVSGGR